MHTHAHMQHTPFHATTPPPLSPLLQEDMVGVRALHLPAVLCAGDGGGGAVGQQRQQGNLQDQGEHGHSGWVGGRNARAATYPCRQLHAAHGGPQPVYVPAGCTIAVCSIKWQCRRRWARVWRAGCGWVRPEWV